MSTSLINVRYTRDHYGITSRRLLDELIASRKILQFYRESQKKWVTVGVDPTRMMDTTYAGLERRSH